MQNSGWKRSISCDKIIKQKHKLNIIRQGMGKVAQLHSLENRGYIEVTQIVVICLSILMNPV